MPTPRRWLSTSVVDGKIYAIGGWNGVQGSPSHSAVEEYDQETDTWTKKADMPTARSYLSASAVDGKIYAIGGWTRANTQSSVEEYDPATDTWTKKADMPIGRYHSAICAVNGKIYAIGGFGLPTLQLMVEEYDPATDRWVRKADMPTARIQLSACAVNGKIYAIGGISWDGAQGPALSAVEEYDPSTDTWTKKADMPMPTYNHAATVVNGKIYVMGGESGSWAVETILSTIMKYDPATDTWTKEGDMRVPRTAMSASVVDGRIYVIGGKEVGVRKISTVEEYTPEGWPFPRALATEPSPADEATDVSRDVVLNWTPGIYAPPINGHTVYLGENLNDVRDGIGGITHDAVSYTTAQRLDFGTTYYWRVDEVNGPSDYTVYEGNVWSFTTELFAYPIENITATASSTSQADTVPENTINGSGLDVNDLHSTKATDMWLSSDEPNGAWIEYELDKVRKLHQMWAWNSNQPVESAFGFGLKDVMIEYSTDSTGYTTLGTTHEFTRAPGAVDYAHNTTVDFSGTAARYVRFTANSNWGGFMPQYGLSEVRLFSIPVFARKPSPDSGTTDVAVDVTLGFKAGREAETHDVYLSTDEQAVIDSTAPVTTVSQAGYGPLSLDLGTTYYWKINEVNEAETTTTWQGDIWNFSTHEFFVVDDFELYNDLNTDEPGSNRIFYTWIDGYDNPAINGSVIGYAEPPFAEQSTVHGGSQAMPFFYDNTSAAAYSEGERTFAVPQDWTKAGVQTLTLYFYGTPTRNTGGQLYVKVNGSKVLYGGDAADINRGMWTRWSIDLAPLGVNLQNVTTLGIGIDGNGASGTLYFDDIRLYRP